VEKNTEPRGAGEQAAELAAVAALLQIGAELGVDQLLDSGESFGVAELADLAAVPPGRAGDYLAALAAAGLVTEDEATHRFRAASDYPDLRHQAGYLTWTMSANSPFIANAREFLTDADDAARRHRRDGRRVAVSSRWIGERAFYPAVVERVQEHGARRVVDLGAGAAGLLIQQLLGDPGRTGLALDISSAACAAAREAAERAGVADRLEVTERSIESLVEDPGPIVGADVIQACFVMHDAVQDRTLFQELLGRCRDALAPDGFLAVVDAVYCAPQAHERMFSALFSYLHESFMGIRLPSEQEWEEHFRAAGFSKVECLPQILPGGRLFVATK
jgi:SAM-dependent methyltransferase